MCLVRCRQGPRLSPSQVPLISVRIITARVLKLISWHARGFAVFCMTMNTSDVMFWYQYINMCIYCIASHYYIHVRTHTHNCFMPLFQDYPGELVPEEEEIFFWTLWCTGKKTEAGTPTIRMGATPSVVTYLHHKACNSCIWKSLLSARQN